jgi:hypothetical protein
MLRRRPERKRARATMLPIALGAALALPMAGTAQVVEEAVLSGRVRLGDRPLTSGTVILHHMDDQGAGELDSTRVGHDGTFALRLPGVPNPGRGDVYFASVRHDGVMYFGQFVHAAVQLASLYEIQAYDTLLAPSEGAPVALQARNIFLEPNGAVWQATDVFQLRNDEPRTVVARPGGRTWSYPLPAEAREVMTAEGEVSSEVATYEDGHFVVRAALPPGERLFVVRYILDTPEVSFPTPGKTELLDLLVREPAPALIVEGMTRAESIELEAGETFRRYAAQNVSLPFVRVTLGEEEGPPPVQWVAILLTVVLAGAGLLAFRRRGGDRAVVRPREARQTLLVQLARLDEEFERRKSPSTEVTREYRRRRAELLQRLKSRG